MARKTSRGQDWDDPGWILEDHYDHSKGMEVASPVGKASRGRGRMSNKNINSCGIWGRCTQPCSGVYVVSGSAESVVQSRKTRSARPARRLTRYDMIRVSLEFKQGRLRA